jgi:molecular chaperone DnaK (HSP70)
MSVFGVDLGNLNSTVGITRNGGIDIVINEVSKRETSTVISMTEQERFIGESGLDRAVRNCNNTINCVKRFIGARIDDPAMESEKRFLSCPISGDAEGRLMFDVAYNGETVSLYPEQVLAMFIQQLRKYVNRETTIDPKLPADVRDCVITVPCFYTPEQRRLVSQACEMAGVNAMSLLNETTASSIDYGIFRGSSLPEKEADAQIVLILDVGYGATTAALTAFWRGNLKVLARKYDMYLGTRELDYSLSQHFATEILNKYKVDVSENKRARIRLLAACERVKCLLSGNTFAPLNIENLMDVDVNINSFQRSDMETACASVAERLKTLLVSVIEESGVTADKIASIEFIGGGCRVPMFKRAVEEATGKAPSFTLNASESVARGAAITAAVFSPKFQVREFVVNELTHFPVKLAYFQENATSVSSVPFLPNVNKVVTLLGKGDYYPKMLEVTVKRSDSFSLYAFCDPENEAVKTHFAAGKYVIGEWTIGAASKPTNGEVKIRVRIQANGLVAVEGASTQESYEVEEIEEKKDPEHPEKEVEKITVKKQKTRRAELSVLPNFSLLGHAPEAVVRCRKLEEEMHNRDIIVNRTKDAKNELESYILDNRTRIGDGGAWSDFVTAEDKSKFLNMANDYESWLYEEGSESTLEEYNLRTAALRNIGAPAQQRWRMWEDIPFALGQFVNKAQAVRDSAIQNIGKFAHITEDEIRGAAAKAEDAISWAQGEVEAYQKAPKFQNTLLTPASFDNKLKEIEIGLRVVLAKPVPKPPKEEKPVAPAAAEKAEDAPPAAPAAAESSEGPAQPDVLD